MTKIQTFRIGLAWVALTCSFSICSARELSQINPSFPRIGNCYHAGLGDKTWEQGSNYWSKLGLIIGGGYDLHYDWEKAGWPKKLALVEQNITKLRQINPNVLVLPYVDVIEGPDNPSVPQPWWALKDGKRWSGWPGYYRINTKLNDVLQFNLDKVRTEICSRPCFDGVFYDCWGVDEWLVPRSAALRDGKNIVMVNDWNLPRRGFSTLNGVLAEDEIDRVMEGKVGFEDFLDRYFHWTRESRKPCVTMIVCSPRAVSYDPWHWSKMSYKERQALLEKYGVEDQQTMRFGLTTTLMSDGYFGYDTGMAGRGNWWWYKEYDAPLGHPRGLAHRNADGTWQREYEGGVVIVNGTAYDTVVHLDVKSRDVSTGRVGTQFTIPFSDGRIFLPTNEAVSASDDVAPRITAQLPAKLRAVKLGDDLNVVQTPGGLELRFDAGGVLRHASWLGQKLFSGGWPVIKRTQTAEFKAENVLGNIEASNEKTAHLTFHGAFVENDQHVSFVEQCTVQNDNQFTLRFDFTADTDLTLRMWRHYFALPVARYASGTASAGDKRVTLPATFKAADLLPASKHIVVEAGDTLMDVTSSLPLSLVDHRAYGNVEEYLLAAYPVSKAVKQGTKWSVEMTVKLAKK